MTPEALQKFVRPKSRRTPQRERLPAVGGGDMSKPREGKDAKRDAALVLQATLEALRNIVDR